MQIVKFTCWLVLLADAAAASASCPIIPGAQRIWSRQSLYWVFVGELHGSNEAPDAFAGLVCDALAHHKHVVVALERPSGEQAALERVLKERNLTSAESSLLSQPGWRDGMDGRASEAMLRLLLSLRDLHTKHHDLKIFAFDVPFSGTAPGARDQVMGRALLSLHERMPEAVTLVLTGNFHAMLAPFDHYDFAAMYLPHSEVLSLEVTDLGGETWSSINGACGPSSGGVGHRGEAKPLGVYLDPTLAPFGKVDGVLSLGVPLTFSPPASNDLHPIPECRAKFLANHPSTKDH